MRVGKVKKRIRGINQSIALFGATARFIKGYRTRVRALGETLAKENGCSYEQLDSLPNTVVLGQRSEALFKVLDAWLDKVIKH